MTFKTYSQASNKKTVPSVFIGIDPGSTLIGYGVVSWQNNTLSCIDYGTITNDGEDRSVDLSNTYKRLQQIIEKYQPSKIAVERLFFTKNQKTVMAVSETRGAIILAVAHAGIPLIELTPLQVKQSICNYGMADKKQVQRMVKMLLRVEKEIKPDDAADALALAICAVSR